MTANVARCLCENVVYIKRVLNFNNPELVNLKKKHVIDLLSSGFS